MWKKRGETFRYSMKSLYQNYLKKRNFDLCIYTVQNDNPVELYDSRNNNKKEIVKLSENKLFLLHKKDHFDVIQNLSMFLYGRKTNFCCKCMMRVKDVNDHICYSKFRSNHEKGNLSDSYVECSLCGLFFESEKSMSSHFVKKISVGVVKFEGKKLMSPCQIYFYCFKCQSIVRRFHYINMKGKKRMHDCNFQFCKTCDVKKLLFHHSFYTNNLNELVNVYVFDFETEANPSNLGVLCGL